MTKVVPTSFELPGRLDVATGELVESADWVDFIEAGNHLFSRAGVRLGGQVFDPPWQTGSTTYIDTNDNGDIDLSDTHASARLLRLLLSAKLKLTLRAYVQNADVILSAVRHDKSGITAIGTSTSASTTGTAWVETTLTLDQVDTLDAGVGGNDPQQIGFRVRGRSPAALETASIYQYDIIAKIAESTDLPDGT